MKMLLVAFIAATLFIVALSALTIGAFQALGLSSPAEIVEALGL